MIVLGVYLLLYYARLNNEKQIINEMKERKLKYGMVTMCVGTGQGAAGIYEIL